MKYLFTILVTFFSTFSISCSSTRLTNKDSEIWSKKYCQLERLELQEISDTTRVRKDGETKGGVIANGKVILNDKIKVDSIGASLNAGNKIFINRTTLRIVKVSQDFYEKYSNNRKSLCDLIEGIKSGLVQTGSGRERAENMYLDIVEMFAGIDKKKATL